MTGHGEPRPMRSRAGGPLSGRVEVPGDKSISHRALILGALSVGETRITGLLEGQDVLDTGRAMRAFGASVERMGAGAWQVEGVGVGGFQEPDSVLDHGNSGTGVRLVMGAMATTDVTAVFTGDASLRGRPMGRVTEPLALFGAEARGRRGGRLPIALSGAANPMPVQYTTPMPSAQVKSAEIVPRGDEKRGRSHAEPEDGQQERVHAPRGVLGKEGTGDPKGPSPHVKGVDGDRDLTRAGRPHQQRRNQQ